MLIKRFKSNTYAKIRDKIYHLYSGWRRQIDIFPSSKSLVQTKNFNMSPRKAGPYINLEYTNYNMTISSYSSNFNPIKTGPPKRVTLVINKDAVN